MPPIWPSTLEFWDAFKLLSRADGDIAISDIIAWARDVKGITDCEELEEFIRLVKALDHELMTYRAEKLIGSGSPPSRERITSQKQ